MISLRTDNDTWNHHQFIYKSIIFWLIFFFVYKMSEDRQTFPESEVTSWHRNQTLFWYLSFKNVMNKSSKPLHWTLSFSLAQSHKTQVLAPDLWGLQLISYAHNISRGLHQQNLQASKRKKINKDHLQTRIHESAQSLSWTQTRWRRRIGPPALQLRII